MVEVFVRVRVCVCVLWAHHDYFSSAFKAAQPLAYADSNIASTPKPVLAETSKKLRIEQL
jgi:hypothetical protein